MRFRSTIFLKSLLIGVLAVVFLIPLAVASADDISLYPDWLLAGEEPPEGVEFIDGEIVVDGEIIAGEEIAVDGEQGEAELLAQMVSNSVYYVTNKQCGKYIYNQTTSVQMKSGLINDIGAEIKWTFTYNSSKDAYLIRSYGNPNALLGVPENTSSIAVKAEQIVAPSYPDRFYWEITIGANGGCILKNIYNGRYLYTNGTNLYTTTTLGEPGTGTYYTRTWRLAGYMYYGNTDSYEKRELNTLFSIDTLPLKVNLTKTPQIVLSPKNALWANAEDFNFSVSSSNVTVNNTTHKITGNSIGTVTVTATHKVTGRVTTFKAVVCEYEATVNNYYDHGFHVYYGMTEAEGRSNIYSYTYEVSLVFAEKLGLYLNFSTPQYFASDIDTCKGTVNAENINTLCTHSGTKHTERDSAIDDINGYVSGSNVITNAYWTCHRITSVAEDGSDEENRNCSNGNSILILERCDEDLIEQYLTGILMHELCHQYGAQDHYHEEDENGNCLFEDVCSTCNPNGRPATCIMNNSRGAINNSYILCSLCKAEILEHLESHH